MKEFLKDYGTLIGPLMAFTLGVIALYIKFYIDRQVESWRSRKKMRKLIQLILSSKPPRKYYPQTAKDGLFHADQARNLTNLSIFYKRLEVLLSYTVTVENDILTNCSVAEIQQFHDLKFILKYLSKDVEEARNNSAFYDKDNTNELAFDEMDFFRLRDSYERLVTVCRNREKEFTYIER